MQEIPLRAIPSQVVKVVLGGQNVQILLYQKPQGLFVDVAADGVELVAGTICRDVVPLVWRGYTGFIGNLLFTDTQGAHDPDYTGFGSRFALLYLTAAEYEFIQ